MNNELQWRRRLTGDDIADLGAEFGACDADGDGRITSAEFESLLQSLGSNLSAEKRLGEFRRIDTDANGYIDLAEFRIWWLGS